MNHVMSGEETKLAAGEGEGGGGGGGGGGGDAIASFWESAVWERLHLVCLKYLEDKVSDL
jgi:hypothetical protein